MLFERIVSEGLAHYSYLIGDGDMAAVIDPRLDCQIYVEMASQAGMRIAHVFETHRNEDYVVGSAELAARTGAQIWHADDEMAYEYGQPAQEGASWQIGGYRLEALATPGHTPGSMSYVLHDTAGFPWVVFTGDTLFAGDVGRVDLPGLDLMVEMAEALYESLFNKLLLLGDHVIVCAGHGAGSVCGAGIVDRTWTTIGIERQHNPKLQYRDKETFVERIAVALERPPYFRRVEVLNLTGARLPLLPMPTPLGPGPFREAMAGAQVLDTRSEFGYSAAHVPDALSIWEDGVPSFAGWFLSYDEPILLVQPDNNVERAVRMLVRLGYTDIAGYLSGGMHAWHTAGYNSRAVRTVTVQQLCRLLDQETAPHILDVRSEEEVAAHRIPLAQHIHLTQLPERLEEVPTDRRIYVFCGSGYRAMTAAGLLRSAGREDVQVVLGGMSGWSSTSCPLA